MMKIHLLLLLILFIRCNSSSDFNSQVEIARQDSILKTIDKMYNEKNQKINAVTDSVNKEQTMQVEIVKILVYDNSLVYVEKQRLNNINSKSKDQIKVEISFISKLNMIHDSLLNEMYHGNY